jgi:hypothetical protein
MRASAIYIATAAGLVAGFLGGTPAPAMIARPIGVLAAMPALDPIDRIHCRRSLHAHRRGHALSRGCGSAGERIGTPGSGFETSPLRTIQSGTQPLRSNDPTATGVELLRGGPSSNTPSGVRPLSPGSPSTGSGSAPLSSSPSGSSSGSSSSGSSSGGGSSSSGSSGGSM